uniref:RPA-interacting protein C-terminal domain-containing protein n=1 Tax=Oryza meridionalis TaxID=40149 RepID=A0A0E0DRG0_9ORYZ
MDSSRPRRDPIKSRRRPDWREEIKVESAVRDIISDELQKLKQHGDEKENQEADMIWEYQGPQTAKPVETESEDILLEMERLLYEDLRDEAIRIEVEALDEEDEYLAQAFLEHMQLTDKEANANLWCPVCKQGELRETHNLIYCTMCKLRLDLGEDKINLEFLRERLANVHMDHLDRGCKSAPKFCLQTMFELTALYIQCKECNTFDVVI